MRKSSFFSSTIFKRQWFIYKEWAGVLLLITCTLLVKQLFLLKTPLFGDEALYCDLGFKFISLPFLQAWNIAVNFWKDAPGLLLLNAISLKMWGGTHVIYACRMTGIISSSIASGILYLVFVHLHFSRTSRFLGLLFFLLNPYSFFFDRTSFMDVPLVMWGVGYWYTILKYFESDKTKYFIGSLLTLVAMFMTKFNGLLLVPIIYLFVIDAQKSFRFTLRFWIITFFVSLFLTYFTASYTHIWDTVFYHVGISTSFTQWLGRFFTNTKNMIVWYKDFLSLAAFGVFVLGSYIAYQKKNLKYICVVPLIVIFYALVSRNIFPRYLLLTLPFLAFIAGYASYTQVGKIAVFALLILFILRDSKIIFSPEQATLAKQTHFEYFEDWGSGVGPEKAITYVAQNRNIFENSVFFIPTDLEGLFSIMKLQYLPTETISFHFFKSMHDLEIQQKQVNIKRIFIIATPFHVWITDSIKNVFPSAFVRYTSNKAARNSTQIYEVD